MKKLKHIIKKFSILILMLYLPAFAYEDVIITNNSKLTDIKIEDHEIIDVFPLITIMNDKNTIIVHPLKEGNTRFMVLKDGKKTEIFSVKVEPEKTTISKAEGFEILPIDTPPVIYEFQLDEPPKKEYKWTN